MTPSLSPLRVGLTAWATQYAPDELAMLTAATRPTALGRERNRLFRAALGVTDPESALAFLPLWHLDEVEGFETSSPVAGCTFAALESLAHFRWPVLTAQLLGGYLDALPPPDHRIFWRRCDELASCYAPRAVRVAWRPVLPPASAPTLLRRLAEEDRALQREAVLASRPSAPPTRPRRRS